MIKVTMFTQLKYNRGDVNLLNVLSEIRNGKYAQSVIRIRDFMESGDSDSADKLKKQLPATTISATYSKRRVAEFLTAYNPVVILDFDEQKKEDLPGLLAKIRQAPYTVACWVSPRGHGIKIIVYPVVSLELKLENHQAVYNLVKDWYEKLLGIKADTSGSDPGRLCLVSYDPELYLAPPFEAWLKDEAAAPEGLPPIDPPVVGIYAKQIAAARKKASRKFLYEAGNRNNYVFLFASHCNKLGVAKEEVEMYATQSFADMPTDECRQAIDSAYAHTDQHATAGKPRQSAKRGESYVEEIQKFLTQRYSLRRNVLNRTVEYRNLKLHGAYRPVTDYWENSVWCAMQLAGILCSLSDLRAVVHSDFSPEYDPIRSYFKSLPKWDPATDPIGELAATVTTTHQEFWAKCFKKWLVAVVACAIDEQSENHTVLLLSGVQGLGKTTWLRNLVPPALRKYVYSGNLDPSAKDASLMLSDCFLIILDELTGQSRMELNRLKALITKNSVHERRPYARNAENYERRASFAATVNDSQVLTDQSGSRRFLCFEALQIDYTVQIDYAAVYAQALALLQQGFRYWFADADIAEVNNNNEPFQQASLEVELLYTYFRKPERFESGLLLSSAEISVKLAEKGRSSATGISINIIGKTLKRDGFTCQKRHGKRLYHVIELDFNQVDARQKGLENEPDKTDDSDKDIDKEDIAGGDKPDPKLPF